jgi:signal transduction histidine kinase
MRERMRQLGGTFTIAPGPEGKGTLVEAFIPQVGEGGPAAHVGNILRNAS